MQLHRLVNVTQNIFACFFFVVAIFDANFDYNELPRLSYRDAEWLVINQQK